MATLFILFLSLCLNISLHGLSIQPLPTPLAKGKGKSISIVTGANGYVGRQLVYSLLSRQFPTANDEHSDSIQKDGADDIIICLVRPNHISSEKSYWNAHMNKLYSNNKNIKVMPYDMLDGGVTLYNALQWGHQYHHSTNLSSISLCLYHVASTFGPTSDPIQTAEQNVKSAQDAVRSLTKLIHSIQCNGKTLPKVRMVLTSSMAAVRATNQTPLNGKYYTHKDWNTLSKLDCENWGSCYQWSKAESERNAMEMVMEWNNDRIDQDGVLEFVALCPSFVFGPPPPMPPTYLENSNKSGSTSYSVELVKQWLYGKSEVQSRLCVDVRDVALAHVNAGTMNLSPELTKGTKPHCYRYILSREERLSSALVAEALKNAIRKVKTAAQTIDVDLSKIKCDVKFDGGAIKIGEREVEAKERLEGDLGVVCRSVEETMEDMANAILLDDVF
ncbi:hypothetical protein HJC23_004955 [Cyclotella cryptica]|uniref:3-beta hydroxysteroid dehydrogenase/isomerase domain-containing protein n=1 Tax=Cyclotella cryptica TaxID=29204 RepID=A0ABD3PAV1_9STRA|eukprot:CCRYP_016602-RB/>CCRYP_016602-RB protein AED:0.00 eAED:0.00 QI:102/-1/1/1/-1/1/1/1404/444